MELSEAYEPLGTSEGTVKTPLAWETCFELEELTVKWRFLFDDFWPLFWIGSDRMGFDRSLRTSCKRPRGWIPITFSWDMALGKRIGRTFGRVFHFLEDVSYSLLLDRQNRRLCSNLPLVDDRERVTWECTRSQKEKSD